MKKKLHRLRWFLLQRLGTCFSIVLKESESFSYAKSFLQSVQNLQGGLILFLRLLHPSGDSFLGLGMEFSFVVTQHIDRHFERLIRFLGCLLSCLGGGHQRVVNKL